MKEFDALLSLTRAAVTGDAPRIDGGLFEGLDWQATFSLASSCAVTAIAAPALERLPQAFRPPVSVHLSWALSAQRCRDEYAARHRVLTELRRILDAGGIGPVLLLKGETLAPLYPDPSARVSGDIDIMPMERFEDSNRLFEDAGYIVDKSNSKHTVFFFEGVEIENHTPVPHPEYRRCDYRTELLVQQAYAQGKLRARPDGYLELDPVTQAIYTLNHFALHIHMGETVTLRMAADLELLLRRYPEILRQWDEGLRFAGLQRFAGVTLSMLDLLFGEGREPFAATENSSAQAASSMIEYCLLKGGTKLQRMAWRFRWLPVTPWEFFVFLLEKAWRVTRRRIKSLFSRG